LKALASRVHQGDVRYVRVLVQGNYLDSTTGDEYWVTGVKKRGAKRHWAGSGKVLVEAAAIDDMLQALGTTTLDRRVFTLTHDIARTTAAEFVAEENTPLRRQ
jgi:uncharacterized small protein (DUF1192 family)